MRISEAKRFYNQDEKKYQVLENKELLGWLSSRIKEGYHSYLEIEDIQNLIDAIANWYEIKYPEREMEYNEGVRHLDFEDVDRLSKYLNIKELMYRLPHKGLLLIESDYRSMGGGLKPLYDDKGKKIGHEMVLFMTIKRKDLKWNIFLTASMTSGKVEHNAGLADLVPSDDITLEELLKIFKEKYSDQLDFSELEECIYDHNCDIELRKRVLELASLKLLYSKNTIPERGYERAKRFISEFNKRLNLNLSTEEIDEIMNRDYTNGEKWEPVLITYNNSRGEEESFWTVENVAKKEENSPLEKAKQFIKTIFKPKK